MLLPNHRLSLIKGSMKNILLFFKEWMYSGKIPDFQLIKTRGNDLERKLYITLKREGYKIKSQYRIGNFRCKLAIPKYKLMIECEEKVIRVSESHKKLEQYKYKMIKQKYKWKVIYFSCQEIEENIEKCIYKIDLKTGRTRKTNKRN